ncbi:armadillo-type protein [Podospora appendiculata]|uniref:Armadillo-type protein n=1 Tax=Podospora appendiculata TaxID=314037 RepID=A0AAE1CFT2_9PEZI|nr:armadillo-type protein [Podospora appendiculata]
MEHLPLPSSLAEVESLIRALYQPNAPATIAQIQEVLQRLQKSPQGWQLAQSLIASRDDNIKFYAALTVIVKLNRDSASLTDDEAKELLQNIVGWVLQSLVDGSSAFVTKKLCSALITFFIHFPHLWPSCLRHFLYCLDIGRSTPVESLDDALQTNIIVGNLDRRKLTVAVWFATTLVEEVGKTDMNSPKYVQVHDALIKNAPDVSCLLARGFSPPQDSPGTKTQGDTLSCFQAWILYAQRVPSSSDLLVRPLRELVDYSINCFADEELFQATAELFSDVLTNYSSFFTEAHYNSLSSLFDSDWAAQHYEQTIHGSHQEDGISFGLLMLAYGDAKVHELMARTDDRSSRFLQRLSGLLAADGYLVGEDHVFVPALEFWSTFVETMIDSTYSDEEQTQNWRPLADQHLKTVIMNCWRKVQWPPAEVFAEWDSAERAGFGDARKDVADMLQSVFTLNGVSLLSFFADLFLQSVAVQSWAEVEASVFCLGSLSDCVSDNAEFDFELSKVFASPFFELLGETHGPIPLRLRQTGLKFIERYCEYFERHGQYLPHALNLLFAAVNDPVLGGPSARAISTLCSSCRSILTGEAGAFIRQYQAIRSGQVLDSWAEEKIILAIASIIQAITDDSRRLEVFEELYAILRKDFERSVQLKAQPSILNLADPDFLRGVEPSKPQVVPAVEEIALQIALRALRCLSSMAKGMQDVKENIVDLDSDSQPILRDGGFSNIQSDITRLLAEVQRTFSYSGEVVEVICNIYRAGFSETDLGPFVFPADVVTDFFVQQPFETPRLGTLLSTACSFIGSLYRGPKTFVPNHLSRLLPWVISLLQALQVPESDTEVTQNGIIFVDRLMSRYPEVLFQLQPQQMLEFFFLFSLKVLDGKEPLPKNAAADFWSGFITLKSEDPGLQETISNAMGHLGPLVAQSLVQNIGGNAARSELDKLSDPLKKLVTNQVRAQSWLEQALFHESFPSKQVTPQEKTLFLRKIVGLRGSRATNQVVREFWLACRGSNFTYVS